MNSAPTSATQLADALRERVTGRVTTADDADYDAARRVWNGMVDRRPGAVVRVRDAADVATALAVARAHGAPVAVRGGGHSVAGNGTVADGVVVDLRDLAAVEVDVDARTVRVGGGATLGDVDRATVPHGLAVPVGVVSTTGVGGFTLGGGVGWLTRAHGLAVDNLLDAEVVTADGRVVRAAEDAELLWGLKGGGGNFGVVTSFTFRAHALPTDPYCGTLVYDVDRWPAALRALEVWTRDLPDAMQVITTTLTAPAELGLGPDPVLLVAFAWASPDVGAGEQLVDRLRGAAPPTGEEVGATPWLAWQSAVDPLFPVGSRAYWKNASFDRLDEAVIEVLCARGAEQRWVGTAFDIHHMGGAFGRVAEDATPFPTRAARFWLNVYGFWSDPAEDEARTEFVRAVARDMGPFATGGTYVNFMGRPEADRAEAALSVYGAEKLARLRALKRRYDPDNVLRLNHNIPPGEVADPAR